MLLQKIYNLLWENLVKESFMRQSAGRIWMVEAGSDGTIIASDTMTSAIVRLREWYKVETDESKDTLYMQDYVNENYEVQPFWEGHTWENPKLTDNLKDEENNEVIISKINERLKEINRRIAARSDREIARA